MNANGHGISLLWWGKKCLKIDCREFPGGPVAKTTFPVQGAQVQSLMGGLDPTCCN